MARVQIPAVACHCEVFAVLSFSVEKIKRRNWIFSSAEEKWSKTIQRFLRISQRANMTRNPGFIRLSDKQQELLFFFPVNSQEGIFQVGALKPEL